MKQKLNLDALLALVIITVVPLVGMLIFASHAIPKVAE